MIFRVYVYLPEGSNGGLPLVKSMGSMTKPHIYLVGGLEHEFHFPGLKPPTSVNNSGLLLE